MLNHCDSLLGNCKPPDLSFWEEMVVVFQTLLFFVLEFISYIPVFTGPFVF